MKILMAISYYYPDVGGAENYVRQLSLALREREDFEIVIVTSNKRSHHTERETAEGRFPRLIACAHART